MPTIHAKLSASSSARWLNCPGSVKICEQYENKSSSFAEEGTCAHELAEICLRDSKSASEFLGAELHDAPGVEVTIEMVDHVQDYVNYVNSLQSKTSSLLVEEKVSFDEWVTDGFGTSDAIVLDDGTCHIVDLKYGQGVEVYAKENTQAMLYALGVLNEFEFIYDIDTFVLHIYQPRRNHIDSWEITKQDLLKWGEWVKQQVALCDSDDAPLSPSEKACQWCPHKANCKALEKFTEEVISAEFENLDLPKPETVDVVNVLLNKSLIESWLKAVEQSAYEKLLSGDAGELANHFKLVEGRSLRQWGDETTAISALSESYGDEKLYKKTFVSVAQAEKLVGKAKFTKEYNSLVIKPEGKPTIAPIDDKRPAIGDVANCFDIVVDNSSQE